MFVWHALTNGKGVIDRPRPSQSATQDRDFRASKCLIADRVQHKGKLYPCRSRVACRLAYMRVTKAVQPVW
jgi:hypothetical protein